MWSFLPREQTSVEVRGLLVKLGHQKNVKLMTLSSGSPTHLAHHITRGAGNPLQRLLLEGGERWYIPCQWFFIPSGCCFLSPLMYSVFSREVNLLNLGLSWYGSYVVSSGDLHVHSSINLPPLTHSCLYSFSKWSRLLTLCKVRSWYWDATLSKIGKHFYSEDLSNMEKEMIKEIYSKWGGECYGDKSIQKMNGVLGRKGQGRVAMSCKWVVREVPTEKGACSSRWKERDGGSVAGI